MPELPEAEWTRERLAEWLAGRRLRTIRIPEARTRQGQPEAEVRDAAESVEVARVTRRGKFLRIELDSGATLLNHLGMTGKWIRAAAAPPATRASLFVGGDPVRFLDPRRFGFLRLMRPADAARLARMGPEPLGPAFTGRALASMLQASVRPVKPFLMDQDRIAGIGNIQATESLFEARIHPARPASSLGPGEVRRLHRSIRATLRRTIDQARETGVRYVSEGRAGRESARNRFRLYGHADEPCPRCRRRAIRRTALGGRATFHCPGCQPPSAGSC